MTQRSNLSFWAVWTCFFMLEFKWGSFLFEYAVLYEKVNLSSWPLKSNICLFYTEINTQNNDLHSQFCLLHFHILSNIRKAGWNLKLYPQTTMFKQWVWFNSWSETQNVQCIGIPLTSTERAKPKKLQLFNYQRRRKGQGISLLTTPKRVYASKE